MFVQINGCMFLSTLWNGSFWAEKFPQFASKWGKWGQNLPLNLWHPPVTMSFIVAVREGEMTAFFLCVCSCDSPNATGSVETLDDQTETESVISFRRERPRHRESMEQHGEWENQLMTERDFCCFPKLQQCQEADKSEGRLASFSEDWELNLFPAFCQVLAWTAKVDWSATWLDTRAPAPWWAANWRPPASATLRTTTPWAGK